MTIHKKIINLDKNCSRLLDASDLFKAAYNECEKLHDNGIIEKKIGVNDGLYSQPFVIDDVFIDIYSGNIVIYYHDNDS